VTNVPSIELSEEEIRKIGDHFADIWFPGVRHQMALLIAGGLARSGVNLQQAGAIVKIASDKTNGETEKRLLDVGDVYLRWQKGELVPGFNHLEALIREHSMPAFLDATLTVLWKAQRILTRSKADALETPPFKIVSIIMFNSKPAHWQVTLEVKDGTRHTTTVQTSVFTRYNLFRDAFLEDTLTLLPDIKNSEWARLIEACGQPEVKSAPLQAVGAETMKEPLVEFLAEAKENPDAGVLRAFAGVDQDSHFFRYSAFDNFLRSNNLTFDRQAAYDMLKNLGFQNTTKRLPDHKTVNVWFKKKDQAP
jgi:hypothetical protein